MELARRLPPPVQDHLQACPECREAAHELLGLEAALASLAEEVAPPPSLLPDIMRALATAPASAPVRRPWALAAAAVILVSIAVVLPDVQHAWSDSVEWLAAWRPDLTPLLAWLTDWGEAFREGMAGEPAMSPLLAVSGALLVLAASFAASVKLCEVRR
jgi:predicted anti-sigma-YlaC factor YlaD